MEEIRMLSVCETSVLTEAWVWLSCLPSIRNYGKHLILSRFPDVGALFGADRPSLQRAEIDHPRVLSVLLSARYREQAMEILRDAGKLDIRIIHPGHPEFPRLLGHIPDSPIVLYRRGTWSAARCVAIVGSRRATGYGIGMAERLAADLASAGFTIISGLARGIDTAAHSGALQAGGRTVAVFGNGVECIYPPENRKLAERILENGAFLSEYPPGTPPAPFHFPVRNRIVSGLSEAVVVVEAGERSGSLITVQCALEQGRDVFAVPGNATSVTSRGCNRLIREGAGLVQEAADILETLAAERFSDILGTGAANTGSSISRASSIHSMKRSEPLEIPEQIVVGRLAREPLTPDQVCAQSGLTPSEVQQVLLMLELKRCVMRDMDGLIRLIP